MNSDSDITGSEPVRVVVDRFVAGMIPWISEHGVSTGLMLRFDGTDPDSLSQTASAVLVHPRVAAQLLETFMHAIRRVFPDVAEQALQRWHLDAAERAIMKDGNPG